MLFVGGGWGETDEEEEGGRHSSHCTWTFCHRVCMYTRHFSESVTAAVAAFALKMKQQSSAPPRGALYSLSIHRGVRICMIYTSCRYERVWEDELMVIGI